MKRVRKSKISWIIADDYVTAFDKIQATTYYLYESSIRQPLDKLKAKVLSSGPSEFNSWVDILDFVSKEGLIGYATRVKKQWFES